MIDWIQNSGILIDILTLFMSGLALVTGLYPFICQRKATKNDSRSL